MSGNMFNINPEYNIDLGLIRQKFEGLKISSNDDLKTAGHLLGEIQTLIHSITGRRDAELEAMQAEITVKYDPFIQDLLKYKEQVKAMMLNYREQVRRVVNQIKDDIASGTIERKEFFVDDNGKLIHEDALSIRTKTGLSSVRKYYVIRVTDFLQIPHEYLKFDKKLANEAAKKGVKQIPGLSIEEREAIQIRPSISDVA